jgi:hypothetical protein
MAEGCGLDMCVMFVIFIYDGIKVVRISYFIQYSGNGYQYENVFIGKFQ